MLEPPETTPTICCTQCSHQAVWPFQFDRHVQRNHRNVHASELFHAVIEPEQYACVYCSSKSYYKLGGYEHIINKHDVRDDVARSANNKQGIETNQITDDFETYPSQCDYCKYTGHSILSVAKHHDLCEIAGATSEVEFIGVPDEFDLTSGFHENRTKFGLKRYTLVKHATTGQESNEWFKCTECSFRARRKDNLQRHTLSKHAFRKETPWPSHTKSSRAMKMHNVLVRITADDENWFNCPTCSYRAKRKSNLKTHMLTHATDDEIQWFTCATCSFQAKYKSSLKSHMLTHATADQIKWFACSECSFRAKRKGSLKTHMFTHATADQIKWFSCTECPFQAKFNSNLKSHMLKHAASDDIDWFRCAKCSYKAKRRRNLQMHMRTHAVAN